MIEQLETILHTLMLLVGIALASAGLILVDNRSDASCLVRSLATRPTEEA